MKMMQRRDNPLFQRRNILFFALILVSVFSLIFTSTRSMLTRVVYSVVPGIFSFGSAVSSTGDSFLTNFRNKQALVYENAVLRIENSRMEAQVLDRNLLEERVIKLEESLGRVRNDDRVVAQVIAPFGQSLYDTLLIDVGTEHGIKNGDFVVYAGAGVIGKIVEATGSASKVKLFSSSGEEYQVLIGPHSIPATSRGAGGANFEAKIPQKSSVAVGDKVFVPRGDLILGTVTEIEEKEGAPFATVYFRSSFNPTEVRTVEVIISAR